MKKYTAFDKSKEFNEKAKGLLDQLVTVCEMEKIPFFFSACVKNDDSESVYIADGHMTGSAGLTLKDDKINRHMLVQSGFSVVSNPFDMEIVLDNPDDM